MEDKLKLNKMLDLLNEDRKTLEEMDKEDLEDYVEALEKGLTECIFHNDKTKKETLEEIDEINKRIEEIEKEEEELSDLTENSDREYEMEVDRSIYYLD